MPQVRTITTSVAGPKFKEQGAAVEEFWRRMEAANGGRPGDPHDYINLVDVHWEEGRGWVIEYEVPAELLEQNEVRVIREDTEPLEIPLNVKPSEPVYIEPPEGRVAHADKLLRSVDALVAKHKETVKHFNPEANCQNVLKPANLADAVPAQTVKPRPKCHVLSCMSPCVEGSSYCAEHQDKDARFKDTKQPTEIMPSLIQVTGHNPRKTFDPAQLEELKESIREHGIIEPLMVRPKGNSRYELVVGERRLRAARELGLEHVPVVVRQLTDAQMLDIMLAENLQRVDLNPIEEAHHLKRVLEVGKLTQTELGRRVGKSQEWVSQRLRLAEAPATLQDEIIRRRINTSSAIDLLGWVHTEHFNGILGAVLRELGGEEAEISRARVREIIKEITEPVVERLPREATPDISVAPPLNGEIAEPTDLPFVNPEDCKDCDIYDREKNECPEGCTCAEECEDCFCEVTEDEKQDLPWDLEPVSEAAVEPAEQNDNEAYTAGDSKRPLYCTCRIKKGGTFCSSWTASGDELYDIERMMDHVFQHHGDVAHQEASRRMARCIRDGGDVLGLLRKLFTRGPL